MVLYNYIREHYKEAEPIFFSDLEREDITRSALNQQLKKLCDKGLLEKYDVGVYFIPKKTLLNSTIGPNADMVARYRFISKGNNIDGFYGGNSFANQIGISTQVPQVVEIVSNNTNSSDREVRIGNRRFYVKKPIVQITKENVYVLQKILMHIWIIPMRRHGKNLLSISRFMGLNEAMWICISESTR